MERMFKVGDVVTINWDAVFEDGSITEEVDKMSKTTKENQTFTITRVDNTVAYPYVLEGYEITSFDESELVPATVSLFD